MIPGKQGDPRTHPRELWARVCERAKLEGVHVHDLRRSAGLYWARTAGLHVASRMLRHSNISVTQAHYAPLGVDILREAAEARSKVLPFAKAGR
ncbi:MAG: hypothetical protein HYX75_12970 [Acidobacteria bacterium]|nr:hypothetical protein [Acidobacteriota bacterium]